MNNKSNFLNLPSDLPGDARRHVPFRSIINKHFSVLFVLFFVFSILFSYVHPVAALADPQPEYDPVYNTEIVRLSDYVNNDLTPEQQDIFYIMFGAYLVAQGAMSDYLIDDPYTTQDGVIGWLRSCGIQIYNSAIVQNALISPSVLVSQGLQDLVNSAMGFAVKAGLYQSKVTFLDDIMNSDYYFLPYNQGLQIGINQVLASQGGLYDWQFTRNSWISDFVWNQYDFSNLSSTLVDEYNIALSNLGDNRMLVNNEYSYSDFGLKNAVFSPQFNFDLFINNVNHTVNFIFDDSIIYKVVGILKIDRYEVYSATLYNGYINQDSIEYDPTQFNSYVEIAQYYLSSDRYLFSPGSGSGLNSSYSFPLAALVNNVLVGSSLDSAVNVYNVSDLNFLENQTQYYLQVQNDYLLDLKGLIQDLIDVTVLKPVVLDNIYDNNGNQVNPVTNNVAVTVALPESGITLDDNLFHDLTKQGSYISYLWFMTKPLVQYTSDFVNTMVFDGNNDFNITGPGAIVFGVVSLGLIGGLVVKCLL